MLWCNAVNAQGQDTQKRKEQMKSHRSMLNLGEVRFEKDIRCSEVKQEQR